MIYFDNIYVMVALVLFFFMMLIYLKIKRKKNNMYLFCFFIMYIYVCEIINLTQFPIYASENMRTVMGGQNVWREMNLLPLKTLSEGLSIDMLQNVLMTVPLGIGLPFLIRCSWKKITFAGILAGVLCEIGQLFVALWVGFTFRHVNIDDVILNLTGALLGYAFFKAFSCVFRKNYEKLKIFPDFLLVYVLNVCNEDTK